MLIHRMVATFSSSVLVLSTIFTFGRAFLSSSIPPPPVNVRSGSVYLPSLQVHNRFPANGAIRTKHHSLYCSSRNSDDDGPSPNTSRNRARTNVLQFLTQRSVQSFMFLLTQCRDPHTADWIERFADANNLLDYHGTGAFNLTRFTNWDTFLLELMNRDSTVIVIQARRRGGGHGGWSKDNPYMKDRFVEYTVDVDPVSLATRILSVREQLGKELSQDLDIVFEANAQTLTSYHTKSRDARNDEVLDHDPMSQSNPNNVESIDAVSTSKSSILSGRSLSGKGATPSKAVAFERVAAQMLNDKIAFEEMESSPHRKGNFDLLLLLSLQEAVHRVLLGLKTNGRERNTSLVWLRDFYGRRVASYFDGSGRYGRADDFLDELLSTPPSLKRMTDGTTGFIDPLGIAEEILRMRGEIALEWKDMMKNVPRDHMELRKALFSKQMMMKWKQDRPSSEKELGTTEVEGDGSGNFE